MIGKCVRGGVRTSVCGMLWIVWDSVKVWGNRIRTSGRRYMVSVSRLCIPLPSPYSVVPDRTVKLTELAPT